MKRAFSLIETVIAIGVLAVLLTGFMIVFAPAAAGIKKSINAQEADRLASTLEQELVTLRNGEKTFSAFDEPTTFKTGFDKAFFLVRNSFSTKPNPEKVALMVYQYRGSLSSNRSDGTPKPVANALTNRPGVDYSVISVVRRMDDSLFKEDMEALEGGVYVAKCKQLVFNNNELTAGTQGQIKNPKPNTTPPDPAYQPGPFNTSDPYPEAVIAFSAEFYSVPGKRAGYFNTAFTTAFPNLKNPVFTRNLAVRR